MLVFCDSELLQTANGKGDGEAEDFCMEVQREIGSLIGCDVVRAIKVFHHHTHGFVVVIIKVGSVGRLCDVSLTTGCRTGCVKLSLRVSIMDSRTGN